MLGTVMFVAKTSAFNFMLSTIIPQETEHRANFGYSEVAHCLAELA
jgi:hypothetical protein